MSDRALVGNAADPQQIAEGTRRQRDRQKQRDADLRAVLRTTEGARYLAALLGDLLPDSPLVAQDTHATYLNLGWREAGRHLRAEIRRVAPDAYATMRQEHDLNG